MFDTLFRKEPQYDENGRLVGYSQPKIVWIIVAVVVFYCCKDKLMKQRGGGTSRTSSGTSSGQPRRSDGAAARPVLPFEGPLGILFGSAGLALMFGALIFLFYDTLSGGTLSQMRHPGMFVPK